MIQEKLILTLMRQDRRGKLETTTQNADTNRGSSFREESDIGTFCGGAASTVQNAKGCTPFGLSRHLAPLCMYCYGEDPKYSQGSQMGNLENEKTTPHDAPMYTVHGKPLPKLIPFRSLGKQRGLAGQTQPVDLRSLQGNCIMYLEPTL